MICTAAPHNLHSTSFNSHTSTSKERVSTYLKVTNGALSSKIRVKNYTRSRAKGHQVISSKFLNDYSVNAEELANICAEVNEFIRVAEVESKADIAGWARIAKAEILFDDYTFLNEDTQGQSRISEYKSQKDSTMELIGKEFVLKNTINFTFLGIVAFWVASFAFELPIVPVLAATISGFGVLGSCGIQLNKIDELKS